MIRTRFKRPATSRLDCVGDGHMNDMSFSALETALATGFRATIYCRLSKDDDLETESASIANQELLCKGWSHHLIHMTAVHLWQNGP